MNISVTFSRATLNDIAELRHAHLHTLRQPQDLLLEKLVPAGEVTLVFHQRAPAGYAIIHPERGLLEYYLEPRYWVFGEHILRQLVVHFRLRNALVQSFDDLLLSSALELQTSVRPVGLLVRDYIPRTLPDYARIRYRKVAATLDDLPRVIEVEQDVFTNVERLRDVIRRGFVWLFECAPPERTPAPLLGFGIIHPIFEGSRDVDVGIALDRRRRNRGHAIYLLRDMFEQCLRDGLRPVAGCSSDNLPSRRMGERVGLVARYRLLEIAFPPSESIKAVPAAR